MLTADPKQAPRRVAVRSAKPSVVCSGNAMRNSTEATIALRIPADWENQQKRCGAAKPAIKTAANVNKNHCRDQKSAHRSTPRHPLSPLATYRPRARIACPAPYCPLPSVCRRIACPVGRVCLLTARQARIACPVLGRRVPAALPVLVRGGRWPAIALSSWRWSD